MPFRGKDYPALIMGALIWGIFGGFVGSGAAHFIVPLVGHELGFKLDDIVEQTNWIAGLGVVGFIVGVIAGIMRSLRDPY